MPALWTTARRRELLILVAIALARAAAAILVAFCAARLLTAETTPGPGGFLALTALVGVGAAALVALRTLQKQRAEAFALGHVRELRVALISHAVRAPQDEPSQSFGLVMTRVVNDLSAIKLWLSDGLATITVAIVMLGAIGLYLAFAAPALVPIIAAPFGVWLIIVGLSAVPLQRAIKKSRRERGRIASMAGDLLPTRLTHLVYGRHGEIVRRVDRRSRAMSEALVRRALFGGLARAASDVLVPGAAIAAALLSMSSGMSGEEIGVLFLLTGLMAGELTGTAASLDYRLAANVARMRLASVFARPAFELDDGNSTRPMSGTLTVTDLPLGGEDGAPVRRVSFAAAPGEAVALAGLCEAQTRALLLSLAGVSTAHMGTGARVRIDGHGQDDARPRDWWRAVTGVSPDFPSTERTLAKNLTLGARIELDKAESRALAVRFGLDEAAFQDKRRGAPALASIEDAAVRSIRAVMRGAPIVLVADKVVTQTDWLARALVESLQARGATAIFLTPPNGDFVQRVVDLSGQGAGDGFADRQGKGAPRPYLVA